MRLFSSCHIFSHPFDRVSLASWRKYPNDMSQQVMHVEIIGRSVDAERQILRTERLFVVRQKLPAILEWFVGKDAVCYVHEVSEVNALEKTMTMRSRNLTYAHLLQVEEVCHYEADPSVPDGDGTKFVQEARFVACGVNVSSVAQRVEEVCVSNFARNAERGRQGLESVINKIVAETREFADKTREFADKTRELADKTRELADEFADKTRELADNMVAKRAGNLFL